MEPFRFVRPPTLARLSLSVMIFPHGAQKMLGWFGGYGFSGTMGYFTGTLGIPAVFAFLAIVAEFFGGAVNFLGVYIKTEASILRTPSLPR